MSSPLRTLRRWTRPARHAVAYFSLRALVGLLRCLPTLAAFALGAALGRLIGSVARADSKRMRDQLGEHLDDPPSASACWADLGRRFVEFALARRLLSRVELMLPSPLPTGPRIVATSHLGNWELLGAALVARGFDVHAIGARQQPGPLFRWLNDERARLGVTVWTPGQARPARDHLAKGGVLVLFIDQNTGERSAMIPFLGQDAPVPLTFERLQRSTNATALFAWLIRQDRGWAGAVELLPASKPLSAATQRLDPLVREHPTQWIWQHPRWRL